MGEQAEVKAPSCVLCLWDARLETLPYCAECATALLKAGVEDRTSGLYMAMSAATLLGNRGDEARRTAHEIIERANKTMSAIYEQPTAPAAPAPQPATSTPAAPAAPAPLAAPAADTAPTPERKGAEARIAKHLIKLYPRDQKKRNELVQAYIGRPLAEVGTRIVLAFANQIEAVADERQAADKIKFWQLARRLKLHKSRKFADEEGARKFDELQRFLSNDTAIADMDLDKLLDLVLKMEEVSSVSGANRILYALPDQPARVPQDPLFPVEEAATSAPRF